MVYVPISTSRTINFFAGLICTVGFFYGWSAVFRSEEHPLEKKRNIEKEKASKRNELLMKKLQESAGVGDKKE